MKAIKNWRTYNFGGLPPEYSDYKSSRIVVIPVPYDSTTEWISGCRFGPMAIIEASRYLEWYEVMLDKEVYRAGIHTLHEVEPHFGSAAKMINRVYKVVKEVALTGKIPAMLGGEHTLSAGAVRAVKELYPDLTVVYFDAHLDQRDNYLGTRYGDACVMRRVKDICPVIPIGVRSFSKEEKTFIENTGQKVIFAEQILNHKIEYSSTFSNLSNHIYISVDLDVFDPSIMPAVGTPEPGGLQWYDMIELIKCITAGRKVVGFDIVELCQSYGNASCAFTAARLAYIIMGLSTELA